MPKTPETYTAGRADHTAHVVTTYEGTCQIYSPSPGHPGASSYVPFSCGHTNHPDYTTAQDCVHAKALREVRRLNREYAATAVLTPCTYDIHTERPWHDEPEHHMRVCTTHHTTAGTLHPDRSLAETTEWRCPWQHLAGVADLADRGAGAPAHTWDGGLHSHDSYEPHSHEVRADHGGVRVTA